jgi:hydroxymethylbilane synthase
MSRTLTIGTRGSRLALRQSELIAEALRRAHPSLSIELQEIRTEGDASQAPLSEIGGLGVFTKAIEDALLARTVDVAVHSLKDLPAQLTPGLVIAAVPEREDPRDALVTAGGRTFSELAPGARIGTGSGRRAVQLRAIRPDIEPTEIRGNVDTRIRKVDEGEYDGAVLAMAGLKRLGLELRPAMIFSPDVMLPAVGQAALAVQCRADDDELIELLTALDDTATHVAVDAERALLRRLGAGCRMPVGALAATDSDTVTMQAMMADDTGAIVRMAGAAELANASALGEQLADALLSRVGGAAAT